VAVALVVGATAFVVADPLTDDQPRQQLDRISLDARAFAVPLAKAADRARLATGDLDALLEGARTTPRLDLRFEELRRDGFVFSNVVLRKQPDGRFAAEATADPAQFASLVPAGLDLEPDLAASGPGIVLRGDGPFGVNVTVRVRPRGGRVIAEPEGLTVADVVLFDDPRVVVDGLSARAASGGLRARVVGRLR